MTLPVQTDMIVLTVLVSGVCAIISPFLLMGRQSYISEVSCRSAILGIALGGLIAHCMSSFLIAFAGTLAAFCGAIAVRNIARVASISRLNICVSAGALLLSVGVIIAGVPGGISFNSLLFGETSLSSLERATFLSLDIGPKGLYALITALILICLCLILFYKDLKLELFDAGYAASLYSKRNFRPMMLPAMTALAVGASAQVAGLFMTPALLLLPAATAYFYTKRLSAMIVISVIVALVSALTGYGIAYDFKSSPAGAVICVMGTLFLLSALFAPETGFIYRMANKRRKEEALKEHIILTDLQNDRAVEDIFDYHDENVMAKRLNMKKDKFMPIILKLNADGLVHMENGTLCLTEAGKIKCDREII